MANQIKIPKEIAESTNRIQYVENNCNCEIDLLCVLIDEYYLIDESFYLSVNGIPEVKAVFDTIDFDSFERIDI